MRKTIFILSAITAVTIIAAACNSKAGNKKTAEEKQDKAALLKRGEYLVTIGGCDDCHSPKKMGAHGPEIDMERRLSGFPATRPLPQFDSNVLKKGIMQFNDDLTSSAGPWGISFAANLTSDASGAGSWPLENFKFALRHGKLKGLAASRDILPPMPWFNFAKMTDDDLEALHTFLQNTKPIENVVPGPKQFSDLK
ncbi:MAG: diheme cytochrome c-553 [Bacteroidota bacterium]